MTATYASRIYAVRILELPEGNGVGSTTHKDASCRHHTKLLHRFRTVLYQIQSQTHSNHLFAEVDGWDWASNHYNLTSIYVFADHRKASQPRTCFSYIAPRWKNISRGNLWMRSSHKNLAQFFCSILFNWCLCAMVKMLIADLRRCRKEVVARIRCMS